MSFRVNNGAQVVRETSVGVSAAGASAITTQNIVVSGIVPEMLILGGFASAHSAGFFLQDIRVLSANNLQLAFFNATAGSITHGATQFRFISA